MFYSATGAIHFVELTDFVLPLLPLSQKITHRKDTNNQKNMLTSCDISFFIRPIGEFLGLFIQ